MPLQHVDHVVRQERLGEPGEAADVGEEHGDVLLLADRLRSGAVPGHAAEDRGRDTPDVAAHEARPDVGELDVVIVEHKTPDRQIGRDPGLAREAELGTEAEAFGDRALLGRLLGARSVTFDDDDTARRARCSAPHT